MNRRTYIRAVGAAAGLTAVGSTGASALEASGVPEAVEQAPVGASDAKVPEVPDGAIDVRDHGAKLDGSHDDHDALQSALDAAATSGGTVYVPPGELLIEDRVLFRERHSGVTLLGAGSDTHVRLAGGHNGTHVLFHIHGGSGPIQNLKITSLRLNGNKNAQSDNNGWGISATDSGHENQDIQIENVWVHDCSGINLLLSASGMQVNDSSVWNAGRWHGILTGVDNDEPVVLDGIHAYNNSVHGLNCQSGRTVVRNTLSEGNGWGAKNTPATKSCKWKNVVFRDNEHHGFMFPSATNGDISFDNVVAEGNGKWGFRFAHDSTVTIGTIAARNNDTSGNGTGNVYIGGPIELHADTIFSFDVDADGLVIHDYDGGPSGNIGAYIHGSTDDAIQGRPTDLSLGEIKQGEYPDINPLNDGQLESMDTSSSTDSNSDIPVTDGLVLSLDASAGVSTNNGQVTGWADQSGQGNDLTANGNPTLTTAPSGAQAISFDGSGDELVRTSSLNGFPTGSEARTVFMVGKYESTGFGGVTYGSASWNDAFGTVVSDSGELTVQGWSDSNDFVSGTQGTGAGWLTQSVTYDGSQFVHYNNGTQIDSGTHEFTTEDEKLAVGAELGTPPYLDMQVSAVVVYNRSLSDTERQEVQQHLNDKYLNT